MFGRRKRSAAGAADDAGTPGAADDTAGAAPSQGPWDAADVDLADPETPRVDLGSLLVSGTEGLELRLQADQASGVVTAVVLAAPDGAVELRAFAVPKSGGLWAELRREIGAEATRLGGTVDEDAGGFGPQLRLRVPVKAADGRSGVQVSRVVGVEGPRWLLRATFLGAAAQGTDPEDPLERAVRAVVVVRGASPMSPRDPLPLRLPPDTEAASVDGEPLA